MIRLYRKITILFILKTSSSLKMSCVHILDDIKNNDYTTLLYYLLHIDFDMLSL